MSVPKTIHCCWFGGPKTKLAAKCRASWECFAPEWKIREWNLADLIAVRDIPEFCTEAIRRKKWAFASDWMRFWVLAQEGGVYLDCDVELIAPLESLPTGEWIAGEWDFRHELAVNPGSGIALEKGSAIACEMLQAYERAHFDGKTTVGERMADVTRSSGILVLPPEVMSPIGIDGRMHRTEKTVGVHHYALSWGGPKQKMLQWLSWHGLRGVVEAGLWVKHRMEGR